MTSGGIPFRDIAIETAPRSTIERVQLDGLKRQVEQGLKTEFYRKRLTEAGIASPDAIETLADIRKLPFTTKGDLREAYPFGSWPCPERGRARARLKRHDRHAHRHLPDSEGPRHRGDTMARSLAAAGGSKDDVVQNMMTYGLFTGGLCFHYGAELMGAMVILRARATRSGS
jgi:phenylacetate-CoA ligase